MERMDVGKRIRELQDRRGVSTRALARIMDAHPNQVVRWRNAKTVKVSVVEDFCAAMELELPDFFSDYDDL
jgi:transcriptional regulator with XRE-family HTH domain